MLYGRKKFVLGKKQLKNLKKRMHFKKVRKNKGRAK